MKFNLLTIAALGMALGQPALAQTSAKDHAAHHPDAQSNPAELWDGEVRKVDKGTKKITIKHGPLKSLDMPAMTMVFVAKDPKMLDKVKAGDKIRFEAGKAGEQFTVNRIEPAK